MTEVILLGGTFNSFAVSSGSISSSQVEFFPRCFLISHSHRMLRMPKDTSSQTQQFAPLSFQHFYNPSLTIFPFDISPRTQYRPSNPAKPVIVIRSYRV